MQQQNEVWVCQKCGSCCRFVFDTFLDDGTGKCIHLKDNLCLIYDSRPQICRVDRSLRKDKDLLAACSILRRLRKDMNE